MARIRPESFETSEFEPVLAALAATPAPIFQLDVPSDESVEPTFIDNGEVVTLPHCTAAWTFANIWSDGSVLPCCSSMPSMGTVRDKSFADIWTGPAYQELRASLLGQGEVPTKCVGCTDSSRFTRLLDIVQTIIAERPSVKFRVLFDPRELPEHLHRAWNEIGAADRTLQSATTAQSETSAD